MVHAFDQWLHQLGALGYVLLGVAAFVEYVFPPFPGDTILVLGGVYAVRGERSWALVLAATFIGSVLGAAVAYGFGRLIANHLEHREHEQPKRLPFGISAEHLHELQAKMRERGGVLLALNRFMPGVRGLIFVAAGGARMPVGKVLALGAASAAAWNILVLVVGVLVGGNAERLEWLAKSYQQLAWMALLSVALFIAARILWRRRSTAAR